MTIISPSFASSWQQSKSKQNRLQFEFVHLLNGSRDSFSFFLFRRWRLFRFSAATWLCLFSSSSWFFSFFSAFATWKEVNIIIIALSMRTEDGEEKRSGKIKWISRACIEWTLGASFKGRRLLSSAWKQNDLPYFSPCYNVNKFHVSHLIFLQLLHRFVKQTSCRFPFSCCAFLSWRGEEKLGREGEAKINHVIY